MKQRLPRHQLFLSALFLFTALPAVLATEWTNTSIGDWFLDPNWDAGVPTSQTLVIIDNGGTAFIVAPNAASEDLWLGYNAFNQVTPGKSGTLLVGKSPTGIVGTYRAAHISIGRVFDNVPPQPLTGTLNISGGSVVEAIAPDVLSGTTVIATGIVIGHNLYGGGPGTGSVDVSGAGSRLISDYGPIALGVGNATGTLVIESGGNAQSPRGEINIGLVTVKGAGSTWNNTTGIYVGRTGSGNSELDILSGGLVKTALLKLQNGLVLVENGSSTVAGLEVSGLTGEFSGSTNGQLVVGNTTGGRMVISNGGAVVTYRGFMGGNSGGVGSAVVKDAKSKWTASGSIWVGNAGNGIFEILSGGTVTSTGNGYLAFSTNTTGTATVDGTKSTWTMGDHLYVGGNGAAPGGTGHLIISNGGTVGAIGTVIWNTGLLTFGPNATLSGPLTVAGGTMEAAGSFTFPNNITLGAGGLFFRTNGFNVVLSGGITGSGGLTKSGTFTGSGAGILTLTGTSTYTGPTAIFFGTLVVDGSITSEVTINTGTLAGTGTVGGIVVNSGGNVSPGDSPGILRVNGNYLQKSGGVLNVQIGGPNPGTGFDQVTVTGSATVAGTLNLSLVNGYRPVVGQEFAILTSSSETGNFATINSTGFTVTSKASSTGIVLEVTSVVPGAPVITSATGASGVKDAAFNYQITATESPTSFNATGLPPGLSVNTTTGTVSGSPSAIGSFDVVISATNSTGTGSATLTLTIAAPPAATPPPTTLANISTRLRVETGDNVLIGGFIVTGTQPKRVIIRGIGTSLPFADKLANPTLELHGPNGLIESDDDWMDSPNRQAIIDSTIPPTIDLESAIVATLPANGTGYTAIVSGANSGTGIGVVEAYDLDRSVDSMLANISTRGFVSTGDNILIAGTIVLGPATRNVIIRAIGPSLPIAGTLADPTLELRDQNGALLQANDNWVDSPDKQAIIDSTIPPTSDQEAAIVATLSGNGASYTAIVRGVNDTTGIAVVEVYALQ